MIEDKTDPIEVVLKTTGATIGYACGTCGVVWMAPASMTGARPDDALADARDGAQRCCKYDCKDCGAAVERRIYSRCAPCRAAQEKAKDVEDFTEAEKIPAADYVGWVCWGDHGPNEGYFASVADLIEHCAAHKITSPPFAWACFSLGFALNADDVLDSALQERHHDDARDWLVDVEGFRAFIDTWTAKQTLVSYFEDRSRAVVLGGE